MNRRSLPVLHRNVVVADLTPLHRNAPSLALIAGSRRAVPAGTGRQRRC
jgi:hypothetical protein